ncbi:MAG TPA: acetate uptake transporter, partial [Marmoricola sp.]|nr:acetate uptake transporter [Marmoricola sp.]
MSDSTPAPGSHYADPGPLGLAAFAATTFVLSFANTGVFKAEPVVFSLALIFGGLAQVLAGMWEFAKGNTFGATAFTSYGAFWISFWYLTNHTDLTGLTGKQVQHGIAMWLLVWTIFTAYMLVASLGTKNYALIGVFAALTLTFLFLTLGAHGQDPTSMTHDGMTKLGGWLGVIT